MADSRRNEELTPRQIVSELDKYIVGQAAAKRCVAIALRNRYRRKLVPEEFRDEVFPKNILMIGPTGVGKTEIARRLAKLVNAPFVKVEATKFTEVGYVGRDVETMVRDLVDTAVRIVQAEKYKEVSDRARELANERLLELLAPLPKRTSRPQNPLTLFFQDEKQVQEPTEEDYREIKSHETEREKLRERLLAGLLEDEIVEIEVEDKPPIMEIFSGSGMEEMGINFQDIMGQFLPRRRKQRRLTVKQARKILQQEEAEKLIDMDDVYSEAIKRAEESGIIFLDEIDKIAGKDFRGGPDVSRGSTKRHPPHCRRLNRYNKIRAN